MRTRSFLVVILLAFLARPGLAGLDDAAVTARVAPPVVAPGGAARLLVTLTIPEPFHANANPATFDYLIPTSVSIERTRGLRIERPRYPPARQLAVGGSPDPVAVYDGRVRITIPVTADSEAIPGKLRLRGSITFQPCDDETCFAPRTLRFEAPLEIVGPLFSTDTPAAGETMPPAANETAERSAQSAANAETASTVSNPPMATPPDNDRGIWAWILLAFLGGLALNLTPCVYPLIPVTVGYFARQSASRGRTFLLAALYVTALAIVYAILGTIAAVTGGLFGNLLQNSWVLGGMAIVMIALALGMMGLYEVRLPAALGRFTDARPGAGGALAMGATMGLAAAPCIGPFVAGLLAYVGTEGDPAIGFVLFLALGIGLGLPYLPLALVADAFAHWPRAGAILVLAKRLLGFALLGLALWFLLPMIGLERFRIGVELVALGGGAVLLAWPVPGETTMARRARRLIAIGLIVLPAAFRITQPPEVTVDWRPFSAARLARAAAERKPVVIDITAAWCLPCQELDLITFSDPSVAEALNGLVALRADVTGPVIDSDVQRLVDDESIRGVPTVLFIDASGFKRPDLRLEGFERPSRFHARLEALRPGN